MKIRRNTMKQFFMIYKLYQMMFDNLKITNEEYEELLQYFQSVENYEYCDKLIKIKNNSLSNVAQ